MRWRENKQLRHWLRTAALDRPLPATEGGQYPSTPALWTRARSFFARVIGHVGSLEQLSRVARVRPPERRELMSWLRPAEALVRALMVTDAIAWLFMTPEGRKVFRETRKLDPEQRFAQCNTQREAQRKARPDPDTVTGSISIPMPGLHTLAGWRPPPRPEPAPVLEDQRSALADHRRAFKVFRWYAGEDDDGNRIGLKPRPAPSKRHLIISLDHPEPRDPRSNLRRGRTHDAQGLELAARIDALGRVLENPERAIRRLARQLASLDRESLLDFRLPLVPEQVWYQGAHEVRTAYHHLCCAKHCVRRHDYGSG